MSAKHTENEPRGEFPMKDVVEGEDFTDSGYGDSLLEPDAIAVNGDFQLSGGVGHRRSPSLMEAWQAQSHLQQAHFNENRVALGRSITTVLKMLKDLQLLNQECPVYYPGERSGGFPYERHQGPSRKGKEKERADALNTMAEESRDGDVPRLVSPQLKKELNVFKLDVKFGNIDSFEVLQKLEKSSLASLLEQKIVQSLNHLSNLRERIEDTSSKVLITGDLNSGKSTFCNALLRRRLLPADQQPCTNVFCEVRNAEENIGVEEVHAVLLGRDYDMRDRSTYKKFALEKLEDLVYDVHKYSLLKVYVHDKRPHEESLLKNGVIDISLIDAPGLNLDSYQTTQVFSRQEEIDLVVFVVSAENHFTLSAKEFIAAAAHEKSFIFIVVNRFDNIRDKGRCIKRIMDQIAELSPETHKDATEFVHFISAENVLLGGPSGGGDGGDDDDNSDAEDGLHGQMRDDDADPLDPSFGRLENSLRNFVLEKRSVSKLAPAKTYLLNILGDLESLAEVNVQYSEGEKTLCSEDLKTLEPELQKLNSEHHKVSEQLESTLELVADGAYNFTKETLEEVLDTMGEAPLVPYNGLMDIYDYALRTQAAFARSINESVAHCESFARSETVNAVNAIKTLGILHLGNQPAFEKVFHSNVMFTKKRDLLARSITARVSLWDFIDIKFASLGGSNESDAMSVWDGAVTLTTVFSMSQLVYKREVLFQALHLAEIPLLRRLFIPTVIAIAAAGIAYVIKDIPYAVPKKVAKKVAKELRELDYVHINASRISRECRRVLRYPSQDVKACFQRQIEKGSKRKEERVKVLERARMNDVFFSELSKRAKQERRHVEKCNLSEWIGMETEN